MDLSPFPIAFGLGVWYANDIFIDFVKGRVGVYPLLYYAQKEGIAVIERLETLVAPAVAECGCQLYDIEYVKEGADRILRLYIDKAEGIDLDDCERVSRGVELVLDAHDPITGEYRLQVSSPGVERKLKKPAHYARYVGEKVHLKLFAPVDPVSGRKKFTGQLTGFEGNTITIRTEEDEQRFTIDLSQVSSCRLVVFD